MIAISSEISESSRVKTISRVKCDRHPRNSTRVQMQVDTDRVEGRCKAIRGRRRRKRRVGRRGDGMSPPDMRKSWIIERGPKISRVERDQDTRRWAGGTEGEKENGKRGRVREDGIGVGIGIAMGIDVYEDVTVGGGEMNK